MSYANIRNQLQTRIQSVATTAKVHTFWRFTLQPTGSSDFDTLFADGTGKVNCFVISREGFDDHQAFEDNKRVRSHHITIHAYMYHNDTQTTSSELIFQDLMDSVNNNFVTGDRSLGGNCLTYELSRIPKIGMANLGKRKDAYHACEIKLMVDEII